MSVDARKILNVRMETPNMSTRVGINGFGRIGRLALRAAWGWPDITFAHINELKGDAATSAHLLTFDSVRCAIDYGDGRHPGQDSGLV
jgi:hypothetical protein